MFKVFLRKKGFMCILATGTLATFLLGCGGTSNNQIGGVTELLNSIDPDDIQNPLLREIFDSFIDEMESKKFL